jgi:hypothetical protein
MISKLTIKLCFTGLILVASEVIGDAQTRRSDTADIKAAQAIAKRFVARIQRTRDVSVLFNELFLADFVAHNIVDDAESPLPSFYSRLTLQERRRSLSAEWNLDYFMAVETLGKYNDIEVASGEKLPNAKLLLPDSTLLKLQSAIRLSETNETSYSQYVLSLNSFENVLAEVRQIMIKRGIEQTSTFRKELETGDKFGTGFNYEVRVSTDDRNFSGFPKEQKFFRVQLPILMSAVLVKDHDKMKILCLYPLTD